MPFETYGKWFTIRELGRGGEGIVDLGVDMQSSGFEHVELPKIINEIDSPNKHRANKAKGAFASLFVPGSVKFGALKRRLPPEEARDAAHAAKRFKDALSVMQRVEHPNLLRVIDSNPKDEWFVSEYHHRGRLTDHPEIFRGDPLKSLLAFRGVVQATYALHRERSDDEGTKAKHIHRDIKPDNIFVADDGRLILGDLGLVHVDAEGHSHVTGAYSKVGTLAFMPPWAVPFLVGDPQPNFDVFCLGKVLWYMFTGKIHLPNEYDGSLESDGPPRDDIRLLEDIIRRCVVLRAPECLADCRDLFDVVEGAIRRIEPKDLSVDQQLARHALSRPGGLHLASIDAPIAEDSAPLCTPKAVTWETTHPVGGSKDKGHYVQVTDWKSFQQTTATGRRLITLPAPTSLDFALACLFHEPIIIDEARYLQVCLSSDPTGDFSIQLLFPGNRTIGFSTHVSETTSVADQQLIVPTKRLLHRGRLETLVFDLHRARSLFTLPPEVVTFGGLCFAGKLQVLFARLI